MPGYNKLTLITFKIECYCNWAIIKKYMNLLTQHCSYFKTRSFKIYFIYVFFSIRSRWRHHRPGNRSQAQLGNGLSDSEEGERRPMSRGRLESVDHQLGKSNIAVSFKWTSGWWWWWHLNMQGLLVWLDEDTIKGQTLGHQCWQLAQPGIENQSIMQVADKWLP